MPPVVQGGADPPFNRSEDPCIHRTVDYSLGLAIPRGGRRVRIIFCTLRSDDTDARCAKSKGTACVRPTAFRAGPKSRPTKTEPKRSAGIAPISLVAVDSQFGPELSVIPADLVGQPVQGAVLAAGLNQPIELLPPLEGGHADILVFPDHDPEERVGERLEYVHTLLDRGKRRRRLSK